MCATTTTPDGRADAGAVVLLAEDDALVLAVLGEVLEAEGYEVVPAPDGAAALARARRRHIDVLLTDLDMPRLDGPGLIRRLWFNRPGLPVVVMSGRLPADGGRSLAEGSAAPFAVLAKPFPPADLVATLRRVLKAPARCGAEPPPRYAQGGPRTPTFAAARRGAPAMPVVAAAARRPAAPRG
jgi:two-component system KDP operon response regulator KdpE